MAQYPANIDLSSLDGTNGFRLTGVAAYDGSGRSVASAGDVNGDGFDDVIVGAAYADPNGTDSGASYVVFGNAGALPPTSTCRVSTGARGSRSAAWRLATTAGFRSPRRVTSTAMASPT